MQKQMNTITINRLRSSNAVNQKSDDKNANKKNETKDTISDGAINFGISVNMPMSHNALIGMQMPGKFLNFIYEKKC